MAILGVRRGRPGGDQQRKRRPAAGPTQQQSRRASPSSASPLNQWLVSAQVVPRKLRRIPPRGPVPKDSLATELIMAAVMVLMFMLLFVPSCLHTAGIGRSDRRAVEQLAQEEDKPAEVSGCPKATLEFGGAAVPAAQAGETPAPQREETLIE